MNEGIKDLVIIRNQESTEEYAEFQVEEKKCNKRVTSGEVMEYFIYHKNSL